MRLPPRRNCGTHPSLNLDDHLNGVRMVVAWRVPRCCLVPISGISLQALPTTIGFSLMIGTALPPAVLTGYLCWLVFSSWKTSLSEKPSFFPALHAQDRRAIPGFLPNDVARLSV